MNTTHSPLTVVNVNMDINPSAQIQQSITRTYFKKAGNKFQDGLFNDSEMGEAQSYTSTRNAFINCRSNDTVASLQALLSTKTAACIYRIVSNNVMDILATEQTVAMTNGKSDYTIEKYEDKYEVKDKNKAVVLDGAGRRQYHRYFFSLTPKEDKDLRIAAYRMTKDARELVTADGEVIPETATAPVALEPITS